MGDSKFEGTQEEWDALVKKSNADADALFKADALAKEETFLDRLIREEQELDAKYQALDKAIHSEGFEQKVGTTQYNFLCIQYQIMAAYTQILQLRIADLKNQS